MSKEEKGQYSDLTVEERQKVLQSRDPNYKFDFENPVEIPLKTAKGSISPIVGEPYTNDLGEEVIKVASVTLNRNS